MNQILKSIYQLGNQQQVDFVAKVGGMSNEEKDMLQLLHNGWTDIAIQEELAMSRSKFDEVLDRVRMKLVLAVFDCINYRMAK